MLIPGQYTKMRWHARNKHYYMERGYEFTKMGDEFDVKVEDLPSESHAYVKVQCDFCGEIIDVKYQNYTHRGLKSDGYACTKCKHEKIHNVFQEVYGVDTPSQIDGFYEKSKTTCQEKYGVDNYASTQECKDKINSFISQVENTNKEYKNIQKLSTTLTNVDSNIKENNKKIILYLQNLTILKISL